MKRFSCSICVPGYVTGYTIISVSNRPYNSVKDLPIYASSLKKQRTRLIRNPIPGFINGLKKKCHAHCSLAPTKRNH